LLLRANVKNSNIDLIFAVEIKQISKWNCSLLSRYSGGEGLRMRGQKS